MRTPSIVVTTCYLCNKELDSKTTPDHIIPQKLFRIGDPNRPKLPVHENCNNLKSIEDEWFVRHLQLRSSFNPDAEQDFSKMIDMANAEKADAYVIGKKLHYYKLARTIFDKVTWGLELPHGRQSLMQMKISEEAATRFQKYVHNMCRGLFMYNVPDSNPAIPDLIMKQYADLELKGKQQGFIDSIKGFAEMSGPGLFGQQWYPRITYMGSRVIETPSKGFLFIQFYTQFGILATDGYPVY